MGKYLLKTEGKADQCLAVAEIPNGFGVQSYQVKPCTSSSCLSCQDNVFDCLECRPGFLFDPTVATNTCISDDVVIDLEKLKDTYNNEDLLEVESNSNDGQVLLEFKVDISGQSKDNLDFSAFLSNGSVIESFKVNEFTVLEDKTTAYVDFSMDGIVEGASILIKTKPQRKSPAALAILANARRQLQAEAASTNPFQKGVYVENVGTYNAPARDVFKNGSLILSIILMVGSAIIIYKAPSWTYRTVEVAIMIGMFLVWNSNPGMYFTNFVEYFRINLFSAIPFFKYDEDKV